MECLVIVFIYNCIEKMMTNAVLQIFCAKCNIQDSGENNDIILCDGFCDRAFHQMCLVPPLETDDSKHYASFIEYSLSLSCQGYILNSHCAFVQFLQKMKVGCVLYVNARWNA